MYINRIKAVAAAALVFPLLALAAFTPSPTATAARAEDNDVAATFKTKCAMCHTPKAEKFFDPAGKDEDHVEAILKGKKAEKPPNMPGFEAKGMKPEEAKALAEYMKKLRTPQN